MSNIMKKGLEKAIGTGQRSAIQQAKKLQEELEINRNAINELIEINNEQTKGIIAIWTVLKVLYSSENENDYNVDFEAIEKDLNINMRLE